MDEEALGPRSRRAIALACASISSSFDENSPETFLAIADDFLKYIEGDDTVVIAKHDEAKK